MKKIIYFLLCFFITFNALSQNKREKIKALKVSFITEKLALTEKEAQQFWPVYNAFKENSNKIKRQDIGSIRKEIRNNGSAITEAQYTDFLNRLITAENDLHKTRVSFINKLKNILPAKKIIQLKHAEEDFKRKMLDQFKKRRKQ